MITLFELQQIATKLTGARFVQEVGPFVLLQHPPGAPLLDGDERRKTALVSKTAMIRKSVEIKHDLAKLEVAQLPPMASGNTLKIGRAPDNDLILDDASASKYHATLTWKGSHGELRDLGSRNGTTVNGDTIQPNWGRDLREAEVISFGGVQFVYYTAPRIFDILSSSKITK